MSVKRSYSSARRDAQARQTRRAILAAALELFTERGYAATSMQALADEADVAIQTVYAVFGSKRELLRELIEAAIVGDDDPTPVTEREESRAIADEPDPDRRARLDAAMSRKIHQRVGPIMRIAGEAAASDPALAEVLAEIKARRRKEMLATARLLAGPQGLRQRPQDAAATLYVLYSPAVADMLMGDYGWSARRYEQWLSRMIRATVID